MKAAPGECDLTEVALSSQGTLGGAESHLPAAHPFAVGSLAFLEGWSGGTCPG